ncbi:MAG: tRNA (guanine-N(1)-)-methyltransferase [Microgenomates group bacterium GW2011_GWC1_41_8]|uniref:tRNA (guanine-N(1)-)-methyltransferase n=4 Tax=Candidatus Roizmaniibacteriota TaxID=1752723 RepID=A0A0G0VGR2_9BACT|nr:MAG: tRNA (guanine-N(1)-)-methyltransferase [Candidatus Levybacteria bacterium GW2011_GWA2_40_16]KKR71245.1 MAG: tRNA (guanine-N(1)-)-methyltransferase [Candidatus Roizmanbacteria bacterium GW2011_GWB1_40_7]KKR92767.1 MAG: tRNA (guanine-N(1)-)-methyltransferase [Candidatus Roizmanbacteria bacterium GW2011_GWA1_41_13]KKS24564.1 MAG: tRNA (guanine-N(1)-)-methyltransferase [Microgenomates group bacterium GW2011_GWC1_41_8]OGK49545.1 MAG: tRNA (guanosine(37)-N1)-methyltransferase TrmD [Candidatus
MKIDIITLFPDMFRGPFDESILRRAQDKLLVKIRIHNLRKWSLNERGTVDDRPYGGGTGMLLRPEPIFDAVREIRDLRFKNNDLRIKKESKIINHKSKIILLDAGGSVYTQQKAQEYSKLDNLILICGHYEGVDYRVHEHLADDVISIGDYVLTGGELPAMTVVDSVVRLLHGVLEKETATQIESFSHLQPKTRPHRLTAKRLAGAAYNLKPILEFPQYTRPEEFNGHKVPEILLSGNHAEIEKWRHDQAHKRTKKNRPDLLNITELPME